MRSIYLDGLPNITKAVDVIEHHTFEDLTGCDPAKLQSTFIPDFAAAGCSSEFQDAITLFPFNKECNASVQQFGSFKTKCVQEQNFLKIATPTSLQLRAFLFQTAGFNAFYTGYGYTAESYGSPRLREFWVKNLHLRDMPGGYKDIKF